MPTYFRPRILVNPLNIPQLPSGRYKIGVVGSNAVIAVEPLLLDPAIMSMAAAAVTVFDAQYTSDTTLTLDAAIPGISVIATSP